MRIEGWCVALALLASNVWAQGTHVATVKPQYLSPAQLAEMLGVREHEGRDEVRWRSGDENHRVDVRRHDGANLMILTGTADDVQTIEAMIRSLDVAPRQIMIEAKIVEVDRNRASEFGFDWNISAQLEGRIREAYDFQKTVYEYDPDFSLTNRVKRHERNSRAGAGADAFALLRLMEHSGAATFRDAPRILTLNNRSATILDGQRVTYVTRYSSFTNLFETDTLDAGLTLTVTPSLGESGYLTLDLRTELTTLGGQISGSPIKDGQMIENKVVVKNGETILLGGFRRSGETRNVRRVPLLGRILPFLFSREIVSRFDRESFVALTAHVVDLDARLDSRTRGLLEGGVPLEKK